ncbi:glycosyltransferase [Georgenia halophila]|uniref:Glycosyltransferase n=1 Tax=Georgenia halophila TaxID=620889 RepID=A0ABP8LDU5_9MICO
MSAAQTEDPRMTVVVASRNRRDELLSSLARHRAPVVYVDNASTDGSPEAVREAFPDVEMVRLRRNAGAYARTVGVRRARTPFVAFADDDSWWAPGSLASSAELLAADPRLALLAARMLVGDEERLDPMCEEMSRSPLPGGDGLPGKPVLGFAACGAALRRDAFLEVGGFDPVVRFPGEEDRVAMDLTAAGWALQYVDDVVVHHHPSPVRHSPERRVRAISRSRILTAVMRLPLRDVAARVREAWSGGPAKRAGLMDAWRDLPAAVRARHVTTPEVLRLIALLEGYVPAAGTPAPAPDTRGKPLPRGTSGGREDGGTT